MAFKLAGAQDATQMGKPFKIEGAQDATKQEPSFTQRVKEDISKRASQEKESLVSAATGEQSLPSAALQTVGAGAGLIGDVGAEAIKSATPEFIKQPIASGAKKIAGYVSGTDAGKSAIEKATQAQKKWEDFSKNHPELAKDVGASGNIASIMPISKLANAVTKPARSIGEAVSPYLQSAGDKITKAGERGINATKSKGYINLISPEVTKKVAKENVGRTEQTGLLRKNVTIPDEYMEKVADTVSKVPDINPNKSYQYNYNKIKDENRAEARELLLKLQKSNVQVPISRVSQAAMDVRKSLAKETHMVGDAKKSAEKMMKEAGRLVKKNGYTAEGILRTRQEFDRWADGQIIGDINSEQNTARKTAWKAVRNSLNNLVEEAIPDAKVKDSLTKQSHLFTALENLTSKAASEGKNIITRGIEAGEDIVPKIPFVKPALGMAAALPYAAYKGMANIPIRKTIGKGISSIGDILSK